MSEGGERVTGVCLAGGSGRILANSGREMLKLTCKQESHLCPDIHGLIFFITLVYMLYY